MKITLFASFRNILGQTTVTQVLYDIKSGRYKDQILFLRDFMSKNNKTEFDRCKRELDAVTFSAMFEGGRKKENLVQHSGFIVLDIDKLDPSQVAPLKYLAAEIPFTYACFVSPSGLGLKILVRVDADANTHDAVFEQVKIKYEQELQVPIDPSGKDITRLCFVSWDPYLYVNTESEIFKTNSLMKEVDIQKTVMLIEDKGIDITQGYNAWLNLGFAIADALGEQGRDYYHRISVFSPDYKHDVCDKQYSNCLRSTRKGITAATFFYIAKQHGIIIPKLNTAEFNPDKCVPFSEKSPNKPPKTKGKAIFEQAAAFLNTSYDTRLNLVTGTIEYRPKSVDYFEPLTDYIENNLLIELHKNSIPITKDKLRCLLFSNFSPRFDPFVDYFGSLPQWDNQTDHIANLAATVSMDDDHNWVEYFKKWLVATVACAVNPLVVNHTTLVFSGPQGVGKTTWMLNLCPEPLKPYVFSGTINPNNKDTLIHLSECFLINLDELENLNRSEIGTLKEIITKSTIRFRRAYGYNSEKLIRRASFMGSVNSSQFLNDLTGSRRFLCFEVFDINYTHSVSLTDVYSQAYYLLQSGFTYHFSKEEAIQITIDNDKFQMISPEEELLLVWFERAHPDTASLFLTTTQLHSKLSLRAGLPTGQSSLNNLGKALRKHDYVRIKKNGVWVWALRELNILEVDNRFGNNAPSCPY